MNAMTTQKTTRSAYYNARFEKRIWFTYKKDGIGNSCERVSL